MVWKVEMVKCAMRQNRARMTARMNPTLWRILMNSMQSILEFLLVYTAKMCGWVSSFDVLAVVRDIYLKDSTEFV